MSDVRSRPFPIQIPRWKPSGPNYTGPTMLPWSLMLPHEAQAMRNHGGQTLDRLAERGGLGPSEAVAVLCDREWCRLDLDESSRQLANLLVTHDDATAELRQLQARHFEERNHYRERAHTAEALAAARGTDLARVCMTRDRLSAAAQLALDFHSGAPWTERRRESWRRGIAAAYGDGGVPPSQSLDATTRALCDAIRAALGCSSPPRCLDCGATFSDDEQGRDALWSHACQS